MCWRFSLCSPLLYITLLISWDTMFPVSFLSYILPSGYILPCGCRLQDWFASSVFKIWSISLEITNAELYLPLSSLQPHIQDFLLPLSSVWLMFCFFFSQMMATRLLLLPVQVPAIWDSGRSTFIVYLASRHSCAHVQYILWCYWPQSLPWAQQTSNMCTRPRICCVRVP